jgi:phage shock protein A
MTEEQIKQVEGFILQAWDATTWDATVGDPEMQRLHNRVAELLNDLRCGTVERAARLKAKLKREIAEMESRIAEHVAIADMLESIPAETDAAKSVRKDSVRFYRSTAESMQKCLNEKCSKAQAVPLSGAFATDRKKSGGNQ